MIDLAHRKLTAEDLHKLLRTQVCTCTCTCVCMCMHVYAHVYDGGGSIQAAPHAGMHMHMYMYMCMCIPAREYLHRLLRTAGGGGLLQRCSHYLFTY